jgi:hypothetical protein
VSFPWRLAASLGLLVALGGCMPLNGPQPGATARVTPSWSSIAPTAPAIGAPLDVAGFESRVVNAAQSVPTGTFVLVIKTGMPTGDLTLKYNGAYDVTDVATPRCRLDGTQNGQPLTLIMVGDKLYTKAGVGKYGLSSVSSSVARLGLATVRPDLPTLVSLVGSSVQDLSYVGPDVVNGLAVQHWRALVDSSVFAPSATGTTTVELWLDSSDLLHQVSYSLVSGGIASTTTSVTVTYGDFNSAVDIAEPEPSEVR